MSRVPRPRPEWYLQYDRPKSTEIEPEIEPEIEREIKIDGHKAHHPGLFDGNDRE